MTGAPLLQRKVEIPERECAAEGCHVILSATRNGRPRVWCSDRCRKTKYSVPCVDCGAPLNGSDGRSENAAVRCHPCAMVKAGADRKTWTRAACLLAIREWAAEYGDPPAIPDWSTAHAESVLGDYDRARRFREAEGRWPSFGTVIRNCGGWNAAIRAAGFEPRPAHGGGGNQYRRRGMRASA
jgi:hypothetical protein